MMDEIFPPPQVFYELHSLARRKFKENFLDRFQKKDLGLEYEVIKLLQTYGEEYNYQLHLTHGIPKKGFSGLSHNFDAGIKDRKTLRQCLFEVKYRGRDKLNQENIMKYHHATFEYFLRLLKEQRHDEANLFRCFVTTQEVNDEYRCFFYTWGIALVDPHLIPVPLISSVIEPFCRLEGTTKQVLELIKVANSLMHHAYFSLAYLIPPLQKHAGVLDLSKLNSTKETAKILETHKYLQNEIRVLQLKHGRGSYK